MRIKTALFQWFIVLVVGVFVKDVMTVVSIYLPDTNVSVVYGNNYTDLYSFKNYVEQWRF